MFNRRAFLATTGTTLAAGLAGCGILTGEEPAEFSASPSQVSDQARQAAGYEFQGNEEMEIEREFSAGGQTRTALVTNVQAQYAKTVSLGTIGEQDAAVFTSLTTPQVQVLGERFNPVGDMSARELGQRVQDQYDEINDIQQRDESDVTINGETTTQVKFGADAFFEGNPLEIYLHISEAVELGDDFVVTFGSYPQLVPTEAENIIQMMEGVEAA